LLTFNRTERNEEKALVYFNNNSVKCSAPKTSYSKKMFLEIFYFIENYASVHNINPDKILTYKIIFKLVNAYPETYNLFETIISEDLNSLLNEKETSIFNSKFDIIIKIFKLLLF